MTNLEELVQTLLYEGYALYPYTPGNTKNATPTPFGIVYPPAYAAPTPTTFDEIRLPCIVEAGEGATLALSVRFLQASGVRHQGSPRRVDLPATALADLAATPVVEDLDHEGLRGSVEMSVELLPGGLARVAVAVHNTTEVEPAITRNEALLSSMLSTQVIATVQRARFVSPTAPPDHASGAVMTCVAVNTFPVLAADDDTVMLGTTIILPDHPQIAPESKGSLFDATEIEEALRLQLMALSDGERDDLQEHDPAMREMIERAIASAPEDLVALHGRVTVSDVGSPTTLAPGGRDPAAGQDLHGEEQARLEDGTIVRRGDHVRLRVGRDAVPVTPDSDATVPVGHAQDPLFNGRAATIERIYVDYEDHVHLCVTVDDDPGQELMRDIGRYMYFRTNEVEAIG